MSENNQTATPVSRSLKRKAHDIEEAENPPSQSRSRLSTASREDSNHGEATEESAGATTRPFVPSSVRGPSNGSSSVFRSTSTEEENDRNYTPGTRFTSINRGVSREQSDAAVGQRRLDDGGRKDRKIHAETAAEKSDSQAQSRPHTQSLTEIDRKSLLAAVAEVEARFQREKWELVAKAMRCAGAAEYSKDLLEKEFAKPAKSFAPNVTEHELHRQAWKDVLWKMMEAPGAGSVSTRPSPYDNGVVCSLRKRVTTLNGQASGQAVFERLNFQILPTETLESLPAAPGNAETTIHGTTKANVSGSAKPPASNYQGFGVLVNQGPLQYNTQQIPPNAPSRMTQQQNRLSWQVTPQTGGPSQQTSSGAVPAHPTMSPVQAPSSQQSIQRPLLYHTPSREPGQEQESPQPQAPSLAPVTVIQRKPSTSTSASEATTQQSRSAPKSRKPVSKSQLKYMLRHRTLNEVNKHKPWDVIAQECGVNAPLNEISAALEQAGFPSILYTPTGAPIFVSNPASSAAMSPSSLAYISPYNPKSPTTPVANDATTPLTTSIDLTKGNDKPPSTTPTQAVQNPYASTEERYPFIPKTEPSQSKDEGDPVLDSHEKRSAAMRKAWAKRQAEGRNGRHGGPPRSSTIARNTLIGSSPTVFAAQVLAAAAAEAEVASPSRSTPLEAEVASSMSPRATPLEAPGTVLSSQGQSQSGKKRGPYKKRDVAAGVTAETPVQPLHHPYQNTFNFSDEKPCPYACDKCGKAYTTPGGFNYHRASKPNCETDTSKPRPYACERCGKSYQNKGGLSYHKLHSLDCEAGQRKPDRRINSSEQKEVKKLAGLRTVGGARINTSLEHSPAATPD